MAEKTMKSRERVLAALARQEPDRIPRDLGGSFTSTIHFEAHHRLKEYLGLAGGTEGVGAMMSQTALIDPRIIDKFGFDCLSLGSKPPSTWKLRVTIDDKGYKFYTDEWKVVRACPEGGFYYDIVDYPLRNPTLQDLERFPWPDPLDKGRFDGLEQAAKDLYENTDKCIVFTTGASFFAQIGYLMGWEEFYRSLVADQPLIRGFIERILDFHLRLMDKALDHVGKYIQVFYLSDDLTHQHGLFARKKILSDLFMPAYRKMFEALKSKADAKILFHMCGASHLMFDDLTQIGVDAFNPIQVSSDGMEDTALLKGKYGNRLTFWGGGCDTQNVLPFGSPEDVRREVRRRVADLSPGGGFVFCPVHNIQRDVSPQNVVAMYDELSRWDRYPVQVEEIKATLQPI